MNLLRSSIFTFATSFLLLAVLCIPRAQAQQQGEKEHGTVIGESMMYVSPDTHSQRVGLATRGRDVFLMGRSTIDGKPWAHVLVVVETGLETGIPMNREVSGWVDSRFVITTSTPNGDQIIFGEAQDSEHQADLGTRRHALEDAMRLYYRMQEYFPKSPLAGEAYWRAADLRWQLEKSGVLMRPSATEMSPDAREQIDDETMHDMMKKFPGTKWAELGSYDLIDNKLCGNWKDEAKCPEKESVLYERYAHDHPQSPKAPEALYNAAWRQGALVEIYKQDNERDKSEKARRRGLELAQELAAKYPEGDWKPRALSLAFCLQQGISTYTAGQGGFGKNSDR
jgi:hypothetical protein